MASFAFLEPPPCSLFFPDASFSSSPLDPPLLSAIPRRALRPRPPPLASSRSHTKLVARHRDPSAPTSPGHASDSAEPAGETPVAEEKAPPSFKLPPLENVVEERQRKPDPPVKGASFRAPLNLSHFFRDVAGLLAPREKGDIRDVVLMSLSFAVYVYISQKLVCAYCLWHSMMNYH